MAIKLDLELNEVNGVLEALGQMPFIRVVDLIGKIHQQAQAQANQPPAIEPEVLPPA